MTDTDTTTSCSSWPTKEGWPMANVAPSHNWREGQRPRVKKSPRHTIKAAMGLLRSVSNRPDFDVTDFGLMHELGVPDDILQLAADRLRANGTTWQQLGDACGITRQTAHIRWRTVELADEAAS